MKISMAGWRVVAGVLMGLFVVVAPAPAQSPAAMPAWFREHMEDHVAGSGTWIASNAVYRSANEPFESYGQRWRWSPGRASVVGQLFGIAGNDTTVFWDFRIYWHPGRREAVVVQHQVSGVVGEGPVRSVGAHEAESDQTFTAPDGRSWRTRHVLRFSGGRLETVSFDWVNERWEQRRTYIWLRSGA